MFRDFTSYPDFIDFIGSESYKGVRLEPHLFYYCDELNHLSLNMPENFNVIVTTKEQVPLGSEMIYQSDTVTSFEKFRGKSYGFILFVYQFEEIIYIVKQYHKDKYNQLQNQLSTLPKDLGERIKEAEILLELGYNYQAQALLKSLHIEDFEQLRLYFDVLILNKEHIKAINVLRKLDEKMPENLKINMCLMALYGFVGLEVDCYDYHLKVISLIKDTKDYDVLSKIFQLLHNHAHFSQILDVIEFDRTVQL